MGVLRRKISANHVLKQQKTNNLRISDGVGWLLVLVLHFDQLRQGYLHGKGTRDLPHDGWKSE